jgi:hypothetical protein
MTTDRTPGTEDAASALDAITQQQARAIDAVLVPGWYWPVVAVCMVGIGAAVDTRRTAVLAAVLPIAVLVIAGLTAAMIFGAYQRAQLRQDLIAGRGAVEIVGFVWLVVGLSIGVAFGLRAAGAPLPATIATAIGGVALTACGPVLMRRLRRLMLSNRAGLR